MPTVGKKRKTEKQQLPTCPVHLGVQMHPIPGPPPVPHAGRIAQSRRLILQEMFRMERFHCPIPNCVQCATVEKISKQQGV